MAHDVAWLEEHGEGARLLDAHGTGVDDDCRHVRTSMGVLELVGEQRDLASGLIEGLQEVVSAPSSGDYRVQVCDRLRRPVVDDGDAARQEFCGCGGDHSVDRDEVCEHLVGIPLARPGSSKSAGADEREHVLVHNPD